jgi:hypothetical protein
MILHPELQKHTIDCSTVARDRSSVGRRYASITEREARRQTGRVFCAFSFGRPAAAP